MSLYNPAPMRRLLLALLMTVASVSARAEEELQFWHAMDGALGEALQALVQRFNASERNVRVTPVFKGGYDATLREAIEAQRAGRGPHLVQIYELATAEMMAQRALFRPVSQVLAEGGERIDTKAFVPAAAGYFADGAGQLLALPFNLSTPILYYSKAAFRKANLDPERAPKTWYEMPKAMGELVTAGFECVYTTTWPSWVQVENMSTWHHQDFATRENGLIGLDAKLTFNTHLMIRHVSMLSSWARSGYFTYSGRAIEGERRFARGECGMLTASSASYAELQRALGADLGVAGLPYYDDVRGAPHHSLIGGAGLWAMAGKKPAEYRAMARFLAWLTRPDVQAEWHQRTGYVPLTRAAYEQTAQKGFYATHPGYEIAIRQLLLNQPTRESRGIRLGAFPQIRGIIEEELEAVWDGRKPPKLALDNAAERGNELLRRFEAEFGAAKGGAPKAAPGRPAAREKK